jgi:hypothetical protein
MSKRSLIIASTVGLVFAIVEAVLVPRTIDTTNTTAISLVAAILAILSGALAGRVILGRKRVHRYSRAGVPVLAAISALAFESAVSNWLIGRDVKFGPAPTALGSQVIVALIIGAVVYLLAATVYGFAGTRQGVSVGGRVGLLLLLLLAVLPILNIPGLIGLGITALLRKPANPKLP